MKKITNTKCYIEIKATEPASVIVFLDKKKDKDARKKTVCEKNMQNEIQKIRVREKEREI